MAFSLFLILATAFASIQCVPLDNQATTISSTLPPVGSTNPTELQSTVQPTIARHVSDTENEIQPQPPQPTIETTIASPNSQPVENKDQIPTTSVEISTLTPSTTQGEIISTIATTEPPKPRNRTRPALVRVIAIVREEILYIPRPSSSLTRIRYPPRPMYRPPYGNRWIDRIRGQQQPSQLDIFGAPRLPLRSEVQQEERERPQAVLLVI